MCDIFVTFCELAYNFCNPSGDWNLFLNGSFHIVCHNPAPRLVDCGSISVTQLYFEIIMGTFHEFALPCLFTGGDPVQ